MNNRANNVKEIELKVVRHDRMFPFVHGYKIFIEGCDFDCVYCYGRRKEDPRKTEPVFHERALKYPPKKGVVFINPFSDTFCYKACKHEWITSMWVYCKNHPDTVFLSMTKNPREYMRWLDSHWIPENVVLGATIETNRDTSKFSKAPTTRERIRAMIDLKWPNKFLSIEPVMDFDPAEFTKAVLEIGPKHAAVGYDNYGYHLPEPSLEKTMWLIKCMEEEGIKVFVKTLRAALEAPYTRRGDRSDSPLAGSPRNHLPCSRRRRRNL